MTITGISSQSGNTPSVTPAARAAHGRDPQPVRDPVATGGPHGNDGDPDDTGYSADPLRHRVDVSA